MARKVTVTLTIRQIITIDLDKYEEEFGRATKAALKERATEIVVIHTPRDAELILDKIEMDPGPLPARKVQKIKRGRGSY